MSLLTPDLSKGRVITFRRPCRVGVGYDVGR